jgi:protein TonB
MSGRTRDTIAVVLATLTINVLLFLSIPLLSEIEEREPATEYMGRPTVVSYHEEERRQEREERKPKEQKEREPRTLPQEPPQPKPESVSKPETDLDIQQPEFQLSKLEVGSVEVQPVQQEPQAGPRQTVGSPRDTFSLGEVDRRPRLVSRVSPVYPYWARQQEITGTVVLKFLVNQDGEVERISVVRAEPEGVFEESAREAVQQWQFDPGYFDGDAVNTWVTVPIRFKLSN